MPATNEDMSLFEFAQTLAGLLGSLAVASLMLQTMFAALDALDPGRRA